MAALSLLEAMGSPCLGSLPPPSATAEWSARRNRLRSHLAAAGCRASLSTPSAVWAAAGAADSPAALVPEYLRPSYADEKAG